MLCPFCSNEGTKVVDKRDYGAKTKRRRECLKCKKRFNTHELVQHAGFKVIKKDGRREDFDFEKIKKGIATACEKRPISTDDVEKIVTHVEDKVRKKGKEVQSSLIGDMVAKELKRRDMVAYIRFASVYREFADLSDFKKELKSL